MRERQMAGAYGWPLSLWSVLVCMALAGMCAEAHVLLAGHRGTPSWRPEETLAGYELAAALGADFLEADLCMTRDGHPVCRHECELSETTDVAAREEFAGRYRARSVPTPLKERASAEEGGWYTEDFTLAELRTLRARERLPEDVRSHAFDGLSTIATLEEFLQLALALDSAPSQPPTVEAARAAASSPLGVYLETKTPTYFRSIGLPEEHLLLDALEQKGFRERCSDAYDAHYPEDVPAWVQACGVILQSFEDNLKVQVSQIHPYYPVVQLLGRPEDAMRGSSITYGDLMTREGLQTLAEWATGIGPDKADVLYYNETVVEVVLDSSGATEEDNQCAGISFDYSSTGLLERAHEAGLLVHPYTFRKEAYYMNCTFDNDMELELAAFFELGVDGLFTDSIDVAVAVRERMFPESGSWLSLVVVGIYVVTATTCITYGALMVASSAIWIRGKLRGRRAPLIIDAEDADAAASIELETD